MLIVVKIVVVSIIKTVGALIFLRFHVRRSRDLNPGCGHPHYSLSRASSALDNQGPGWF